MSTQLICRSEDLRRLVKDGYEVEVSGGHLLIRSVPYLTESSEVKRGVLVAPLNLSGDVTSQPNEHTVHFAGEMPHDKEGNAVALNATHSETDLGGGLVTNFQFSVKPRNGYRDYHHKMVTYIGLIAGHAESVDPAATPRTFAVTARTEEDSVFKYLDTATSRAGIGRVNKKLEVGRVAIIGLGGTGSYILDLVAKTPVKEIHLYDGDVFGQHNAFRSPGAPPIETLRRRLPKTEYFAGIYGNMRDGIFPHGLIDESTVDELEGMDFVFVAVDDGPARKLVAGKADDVRDSFR